MRVIVTSEQRFDRLPDGTVWTWSPWSREYWARRYLPVFDEVVVVARARQARTIPAGHRQLTGDGVGFTPVPDYQGPWAYLRVAAAARRAVRGTIRDEDAVVLHAPSQISNMVWPLLRRRGQPYGVVVVGDPADVFAPGVSDHPLRLVLRWTFREQQRRQCLQAAGTAYISRYLASRYPCPRRTATICNLPLLDEHLVAAPRRIRDPLASIRLVTVAMVDQRYKGVDTLIEAVAHCVREGVDVQLVVVGSGRYMPQLSAQAHEMGVADRVRFLGSLPAGQAVITELDASDIFVLASRAEGLGLATLEAMGRGLPCIATSVGGTVELLTADDRVPPNDSRAFARQVVDVASDPTRLTAMSARNLESASHHRSTALEASWRSFFTDLRDVTEEWQRTRPPQARK